MSRRKAEMVLELIDRATRPARRFIDLQRRMGRAVEANNRVAAQSARTTDRAASRTERTLEKLARTSRSSFQAVVDGSRRAGRAVGRLHEKTRRLGRFGVGQIGQGWNRARGGLMAGAAAVTIAYGAAAAAASGLVGTASDFERFQTILETTEGSSQAAREAMGWVQNFAVTTPYGLDQVTDAFVNLRAFGLDPTQGMLQTLGDTSAAMGTPLMQGVEAMADAVMGQNERLLEFGIQASKTGDLITYSYTNAAGEAMTATAAATDRLAIQQTLMGIMNEKYAGSMERLSQTWDGMISNVMDLWTKFQMMIMDAGLFDWMKGKLREVLDTINQMEADGTLQEWATQIGSTIQTALTNMWDFAKGVFEIIRNVSGYLSVAAEYVGGWKNLSLILAGIAFAPTLISTAAGLVQIATGLAALSAALLANPIILAIAAIAGGVYLIYRNWDSIGPYFQRIWDVVKNAVSTVWDWLKTAFNWTPVGMIINNWSATSDALSGPIEAGKAAVDAIWNGLKALFDWSPRAALSAAWSGISSFFSSPVETGKAALEATWEGIKTLFSWSPLSFIIENWSGIGEALSAPIETGKALVSDAWDGVKALFSGDWLPEINTDTLSAAFDVMSGIVQRGWDIISPIFDAIVSAAAALGEKVGAAIDVAVDGATAALDALSGDRGVERIFGQLSDLAENGWSGDFVQGQALSEALAVGEVSLESYRQTLAAVSQEGGDFAETARQMIEASRQLDAFTMPEPTAPQLPPTQEIDGVMAKLAEIETVSSRVPDAVSSAMNATQTILAAENLTDHGSRLMQTLADGIRSKVAEVTAAAQEITRAIRNALPRSATMQVGVQGSAAVQARASGGSFGAGWLLTGENGPELEYRDRGGYIAHNSALQNMVSMSETVSRNAANTNRAPNWLKGAALATGMAASAAIPAAADNSIDLSEAGSPSTGAQYLTLQNSGPRPPDAPISVSMTFTGTVDRQVMPDIRAMKEELLEELQGLLEDSGRAAQRREHG